MGFTHLDENQKARMVNVIDKPPTRRTAVARGRIFMTPETAAGIADQKVSKGDVLSVARVAGIQAAKRTSELIPLCHRLTITSVHVNFEIKTRAIDITSKVETIDRTGVEMEALTACSVAALTIYDMCKALDRSMTIGDIKLWKKTGGSSGTYHHPDNTNLT